MEIYTITSARSYPEEARRSAESEKRGLCLDQGQNIQGCLKYPVWQKKKRRSVVVCSRVEQAGRLEIEADNIYTRFNVIE